MNTTKETSMCHMFVINFLSNWEILIIFTEFDHNYILTLNMKT